MLKAGAYPAISVEDEVEAWRSAVIAAGGAVSDARLVITAQFLLRLKAPGILSLIDQLNAWWGEDDVQARVCLKSRRVATPVNGPVFAGNKGYTGDGLSAYLNTNYRPSTMAVAVTGGNAHIGAQVLTNVTAGAYSVMGLASATTWRLRPRSTGDVVAGQVGSAFTGFADPVTTSVGYTAIQRANAATLQGRKDDAALTDTTVGTLSTALPPSDLYVLARNTSGVGSPSEFFPGQVGLTYVAAPFTAAQWMTMRAAIRAFGQAAGAI